MFGIDAFTPLINQPECAILGVGRIKSRPVVVGEKIVARPTAWLSLTFDHRLVDGGPAARFLQRVVQLVERPTLTNHIAPTNVQISKLFGGRPGR